MQNFYFGLKNILFFQAPIKRLRGRIVNLLKEKTIQKKKETNKTNEVEDIEKSEVRSNEKESQSTENENGQSNPVVVKRTRRLNSLKTPVNEVELKNLLIFLLSSQLNCREFLGYDRTTNGICQYEKHSRWE
jgi:hypothetical protein